MPLWIEVVLLASLGLIAVAIGAWQIKFPESQDKTAVNPRATPDESSMLAGVPPVPELRAMVESKGTGSERGASPGQSGGARNFLIH